MSQRVFSIPTVQPLEDGTERMYFVHIVVKGRTVMAKDGATVHKGTIRDEKIVLWLDPQPDVSLQDMIESYLFGKDDITERWS